MLYHTRSFFAATIIAFFFTMYATAQEVKKIALKEAISLGLANSKSLKLDNAKIDQAVFLRFNLFCPKEPAHLMISKTNACLKKTIGIII